MPTFQPVPVDEAKQQTGALGPRARIIEEYKAYIKILRPDQAGKLTPQDGESMPMVRRRIGQAARSLGEELTIRRTDGSVYFWKGTERRRRGRPRRAG